MEQETRVLGDERDRLDAALDDMVDQLDAADSDTAAQAIRQQAQEIDARGRGVAYLIDEHGADAEVTVRGLAAGDYAEVEDRVAALRDQQGTDSALPGAHRNIFAAAGLVDAPFLPEDADTNSLDVRLDAVADQPTGVAKYLEAIVNDLTTVDEGNWKPLRERLVAAESAD